MKRRFTDQKIAEYRNLTAQETCDLLQLRFKPDASYTPVHPGSNRLHITVDQTVFEIIVTGIRWFDTRAEKGGGGAIDLCMHLFQETFIKSMRRLENARQQDNSPCSL